ARPCSSYVTGSGLPAGAWRPHRSTCCAPSTRCAASPRFRTRCWWRSSTRSFSPSSAGARESGADAAVRCGARREHRHRPAGRRVKGPHATVVCRLELVGCAGVRHRVRDGRHGRDMERWVPHDWPAPETYGEEWAHDYDELALDDPEPVSTVVDALARLAGGGPVLDVAAGTGRVALPLAAAGADVTATDASAKMLARLREKDPAGRVRCRVEVLPEVSGSGYAVVAILANSLWVLGTAREQKEFLVNAAASLAPGGVVVVEMTMVDPTRWR